MKTDDKAKFNLEPEEPGQASAPDPAAAQAAAYQAATRLLCRRGHSHNELKLKLSQRGFEEAVIDAALARCQRHNYLDDPTTCEHYCRELIRKGQGPRAIRQRLAQRGFEQALIEATLEAHYPTDTIIETAQAVAARKAEQLKTRHKERFDLRTRLARFLTQRGFPADVVRKAIDRTLDSGSQAEGSS